MIDDATAAIVYAVDVDVADAIRLCQRAMTQRFDVDIDGDLQMALNNIEEARWKLAELIIDEDPLGRPRARAVRPPNPSASSGSDLAR